MFFTVVFLLLITESTFGGLPLSFYNSNLAEKHQSSFQQKYVLQSDVKNDIDDKLFVVKEKNKLLFADGDAQGRLKRGIVLIDEDFDKLPDVSVQQGWSGGLTQQDPMDLVKEKAKEAFAESGSGEGSLTDETTVIFTNTTPEVMTTKANTSKPTTLSETTIEGSGDYDTTSILTSTVKIHDVFDNTNMESCLNYSCATAELTITPGIGEKVPEDSNLILLCSMSNSTSGDILQWYKNNGSDTSLLSASVSNNQIQFVLSKATINDSGEYVCVKRSKTSCCNRKFEVTFYRKPNYKYHLLIVGLVTVVSLFTCLLLAIHRRYKLRQYKKELNVPIQMNEFLL